MSQAFRHARDCSVAMRAEPMKLLGPNFRALTFRALNLAIPYAVQSGFCYPAIAYLPGLRYRPLRTNLLEPALGAMLPGVQGNAATHLGPIP